MDALLRLVPEADRPAVAAAAHAAHRATEGWAREWLGESGPKLCANLAATLAAIAPTLPVDRLALLTRYCLWTFLLDNSLDDPSRTPTQIRATGDAAASALGGGGAGPVAAVLAGLLPQVAAYDRVNLLPRIAGSIRDDIAGGVEHSLLSRRIAGGDLAPPCAEDYLELASRSIGYRSVCLLLLLLLGHGAELAAEFGRVTGALAPAARAVRLANDLRSARRHGDEGVLDVLSSRTRAGDAVTPELVTQWIAECVASQDAQLGGLPSCGPALRRSLRVSVGMYAVTQLR